MRPEEILHPPRRQSNDSECFSLIKLHISDGQRHCKFWVRGSNDRIEILKDFLNGDGEWQVVADEFQRMVLSNSIPILLFG